MNIAMEIVDLAMEIVDIKSSINCAKTNACSM